MKPLRLLAVLALIAAPFVQALSQDVLSEAVVTSSSNGITIRDNIITYDISIDSLAATKSLNSLLGSMPLVNYNHKERVLTINGKDNICILLNGRKSLVVNKSNYYYISELLQGEQLDSISINTAPDGAYYAYSAVIDIKSKDLLSNLFAGATSLSASTEYSLSPDIGITAGNGRLISNVSYKYDWSLARPTWNYTESRLGAVATSAYMATDTTIQAPSSMHEAKLALNYNITPDDVLFANGTFVLSNNRFKTISSSTAYGHETFLEGDIFRNDRKWSGGLAYQHYFDHRAQKMLTLQYSLENKENDTYYGSLGSGNIFSEFQQIVSADYFHTIDFTSNWFATLAWFSRRYGSVTDGAGILKHNQDVLRADANYSKQLGKVRLSGQISYDYTIDLADFYNGEQPYSDNYGLFRYEARINWFPAAGHSLMAIASRDLHRAAVKFRNPYRDESIAGTVSQGSPILSIEKIDNIFFRYGYMKGSKLSVDFSLSLTNSSDGVFASTTLLDDGRLFRTYYSGAGFTDIRMGPGIMLRPNGKFSLNTSYLIIYDSYRTATNNPKFLSHYFYLNSRWTVWRNGELFVLATLQDPTSIQSSSIVQMKRHHYILNGGVSFTQRFGPSLLCTVGMNEPWYKRVESVSETIVDGNDIYSVNSRPGRIVYFEIRYNFGRFKAFVKRNFRQVSDIDINKK